MTTEIEFKISNKRKRPVIEQDWVLGRWRGMDERMDVGYNQQDVQLENQQAIMVIL